MLTLFARHLAPKKSTKSTLHVGKYISPMDPMGIASEGFQFFCLMFYVKLMVVVEAIPRFLPNGIGNTYLLMDEIYDAYMSIFQNHGGIGE